MSRLWLKLKVQLQGLIMIRTNISFWLLFSQPTELTMHWFLHIVPFTINLFFYCLFLYCSLFYCCATSGTRVSFGMNTVLSYLYSRLYNKVSVVLRVCYSLLLWTHPCWQLAASDRQKSRGRFTRAFSSPPLLPPREASHSLIFPLTRWHVARGSVASLRAPTPSLIPSLVSQGSSSPSSWSTGLAGRRPWRCASSCFLCPLCPCSPASGGKAVLLLLLLLLLLSIKPR